MADYYVYTPDLSIEDVAHLWTTGAKAYDAHEFRTVTGEAYHGIYDWRELWQYREDDRPLNEELLASIEEHGITSPGLVIVGRNGGIKLGEGNHRIQVARALDIEMPVRFVFTTEVETPTDRSRYRRRPDVLTREYEERQAAIDEERRRQEEAMKERQRRREIEGESEVDDELIDSILKLL